jgi:hypothetical protein
MTTILPVAALSRFKRYADIEEAKASPKMTASQGEFKPRFVEKAPCAGEQAFRERAAGALRALAGV